MKRVLQVVGWSIGVLIAMLLVSEVWVRTESVIYLITLTCVTPFAIVYIATGRVIRRRRPLLAVIILALVGGWGLLIAWGAQFTADGFTPLENSFIMNLSTEVLGTALIVLLLSFPRTLGYIVLFVLGIALIVNIEQMTGVNQDVTLNLSTEVLGSLLTALVIYRFVEQFERKEKE